MTTLVSLRGPALVVAAALLAASTGVARAAERARAADVVDATTVIDLEGLWLFHAGDNPAFAQPALDDSDWEQRLVPTGGSSWAQRWHGYAWYRRHLVVDERAVGYDAMLSVGRAREVVEVYLNGSLVAQRGELGSRPTGGERMTPLVSPVPAALLEPGDNLVAVRVYDPTWAGGLVAGPMLLGPPSAVNERLRDEPLHRPALHLMAAALALVVGLGHLVIARGRWSSREAWWLAGAGASLAIAHLGGTGLLSAMTPVLELAVRLPLVAAVGAVVCLAEFFATRFDDPRAPRVVWGGRALLLVLAGFLLAPDAAVFWAAGPVLLVVSLVVALYAANLLAQAARRQEPSALSMFASLVGMALALVYDGLTATDVFILPGASLAAGIVVLLVTSLAGVRQMLAEQDQAVERARSAGDVLDLERVGILDGTVMSIVDRQGFLRLVVDDVVHALGVRRCSLVVPRGDALFVATSVGLPLHAARAEVSRGATIAAWVFEHGRTVTDKTIPEELARVTRAGHYATPSFISHPVKVGDRCIGVINVSDRIDAADLTAEDEASVADVARKLALVLTRIGGDSRAA